MRLDKGFFSKEMVRTLQRLNVDYVLKVPAYRWVRELLGPLRQSKKDERLWTGSASLYGARLLAVEHRLAGIPSLWRGWRESRSILHDGSWQPMPPLEAAPSPDRKHQV